MLGLTLASVRTTEENDIVILYLNDNNIDDDVWMGGKRKENDLSQWEWIDDESSFEYTSWASGRPNNFGGDQNRVYFWKEKN